MLQEKFTGELSADIGSFQIANYWSEALGPTKDLQYPIQSLKIQLQRKNAQGIPEIPNTKNDRRKIPKRTSDKK